MNFTFNEPVIWDSGVCYDIGYFIGEGFDENTYEIDKRTGQLTGELYVQKNEVFKYSNELIEKLTAKYGYEKRFSEIF